ncbi:DUF3558 domain-containing protein [Streptomyces sp. NBC_01304]|uniref:DUF3558 domain-containing protein n=1 Tax=Streptomyces sp. NBC_01304 TaxID=2903818 RepID=UPI002E127627|nr:DUF3558 domain-containing protein [Streptomyces sp. NBC_01304]
MLLGTALLLTGCSGGSGPGESADDANADPDSTAAQTAEPGKYRVLPDPCRSVDHGSLDAMLPGLKELDEEQLEKAYAGTAAVTYDTDRRVGCRWKVESPDATHHLSVDFERVVSYDDAVSDDERAAALYAKKETAADLPSPSQESEDPSDEPSDEPSDDSSAQVNSAKAGKGKSGKSSKSDTDGKGGEGEEDEERAESTPSQNPSQTPTTPEGLEPRTLDGLGDEAFLDDLLTQAGSSSAHRTVTVVFRTSNVIVKIEYDEQAARVGELPDSKELQDKAQELAGRLTGKFGE